MKSHAKSMCTCGHIGDGAKSQHDGINGHGRCIEPGCDCIQFTWKFWLPHYQAWLKGEVFEINE